MEADNFEEILKSWLSKGAEVSRKAIETVGGKVQDFTDKSVVKIEIRQLQNKLIARYIELGKKISIILEKQGTIEPIEETDSEISVINNKYLDFGTEDTFNEIQNIQKDIQILKNQIAEKSKEIN